MLALWVARSIDLTVHRAEHLLALLHPGKDDKKDCRVLVEQINEKHLTNATTRHFDAADYFASISKDLIVEAVAESMGKEHAAKAAKMNAGEAREYAIKNIKGWAPHSMRLGKA